MHTVNTQMGKREANMKSCLQPAPKIFVSFRAVR